MQDRGCYSGLTQWHCRWLKTRHLPASSNKHTNLTVNLFVFLQSVGVEHNLCQVLVPHHP